MLASYDGKPLPERPPLGLSLNAYLSVLSALLKLALAIPLEEALGSQKYLWFSQAGLKRPLMDFERFDDAARGPLGALRLLLRTRTRSLASIGGILFILALALDPFFQQLVALPSRPSLENRSRIPRLVRFEPTRLLRDNGTEEVGHNGAMDVAISTYFQGLHDIGLANTSYFCASDQCTWPVFTTLGICSQCKDISDLLEFGCAIEQGEWRREYAQVVDGRRSPDLNRTSCGWFFNLTSERPMLMSGHSIDATEAVLADDALIMRLLNLRDPMTDELYWSGTLRLPEVHAPITNFAIVNSHTIESVYANEKPEAYNCAMQWCAQDIQATFDHGELTETVLSTFENTTKIPDPLVVTPMEDYLDYIYMHDIIISPPNSSETFSVANTTALSSRFTLDNWAPLFMTQANESDRQYMRFVNGLNSYQGGFRIGVRNTVNAEWIVNGGIPEAMEDVSNALTTVLRNNRKYSEIVLGSGAPRIFVEVQWSWLAFPIVVVLLTITFLIFTIWQMSRHERVWKSSSLTVLVHGLSWDAKYAFRDVKTMRQIREKAAELQVFLNHGKEGGTLDVEIEQAEEKSWDQKLVTRYLRNLTDPNRVV